MNKQTCIECGEEVDLLTIDHIIPKWIARYTYNFGFSFKEIKRTAGLLDKDIQVKICARCNSVKSGVIMYRDPMMRRFLQAFLFLIEERLEVGFIPKKIFVICKCKECEPLPIVQTTFNKVVSKPNKISSIEAHRIMTAVKEIHEGILSPKETYQLNHL